MPSPPPSPTPSQAHPNVLFIAVDDLRPFIGCYGDRNAHTPHIDALARRGVTFTNAMSTAPSCGPSRAALLTGRYPMSTGVLGFQDWAGRREFEPWVTLPEHFRKAGSRTFASGIIHHNSLRVHSYTQRAVEINRAGEADPAADTPELRAPELTVQGRGNISLRDETWRYTRYFDGGEELYNHRNAPYEWTNLAGSPKHPDIKAHLASLLPQESVPTFEPHGLCCWADLDKDDMEQFRTKVWPTWLKEAVPPLV